MVVHDIHFVEDVSDMVESNQLKPEELLVLIRDDAWKSCCDVENEAIVNVVFADSK